MIVGISAAQGQGKSTLIKEYVKQHPGAIAPNIQTSRTLLDDWGYTLAQVNSYIPLKVKFQEELLKRHRDSIFEATETFDYDVLLVERTFSDIFAYALVSIGPFNQYSEWLADYAAECAEAQIHSFDRTIYLSGRDYVPAFDGVRSVNVHFSAMVDDLISKYTHQFADDSEPVVYMNMADLQQRVDFLNVVCTEFYGR